MKRIPFLRDVEFEQTLDYPTVEVDDRPREGGALRCQGRGRGPCPRHGDGVDPLRLAQLLDRREDRLRLPGPAPDAAACGWTSRKTSRPCRCESVNPLVNLMIRDVATVRQGRAARRDRPRHVAALPDPDRERRGRGHGPGLAAGRPGDRRRRGAAPRRAGGDHGPAPADDRDVRVARDRAGGRRVRDPRALDGLFPVAAPGPDLDRRRAGRARGHRDHPLLHQHLAQHRVVHGLDHVPGRLGVELGDARDVHGRALEGGKALDRGGRRSAPASVCGRS